MLLKETKKSNNHINETLRIRKVLKYRSTVYVSHALHYCETKKYPSSTALACLSRRTTTVCFLYAFRKCSMLDIVAYEIAYTVPCIPILCKWFSTKCSELYPKEVLLVLFWKVWILSKDLSFFWASSILLSFKMEVRKWQSGGAPINFSWVLLWLWRTYLEANL